MTTTAYDSAYPSLIPPGAPAILPYADGRFAWHNSEFPRARYRYITVLGNPHVDICDYEPGCVWPASNARAWAIARHKIYPDLTFYCDRANLPGLREELEPLGLEWHLILATLDGSQPAEYDGIQLRGVQYTDRSGAYDLSLIYDDNWLWQP